MPEKTPFVVEDYIHPLNMNGLEGRMLHVPAMSKRAKRDILLLYGHHAMLERWSGLVENLLPYGSITMPDLPGFGGMDSFYKIGQKPTIDNYADYLASFIKLRYKKRSQVTIIGISFGFVIATRMLQRYPELTKKVNLLVSIVGFMHREDFLFKPRTRKIYSFSAGVFSTRPIAWIIRYGFMNRLVIQAIYAQLPAGKKRFIEVDEHQVDQLMEFETKLWQANDVRTHWATTSEFLDLDNCKVRIDLPIWHVASKHDHYFNNYIVREHMLVVFNDYQLAQMNSQAHTPHVVADKEAVAVMLPPELRKVLARPLK